MISRAKAYELVLRCIKAIAGKAGPSPDPDSTIAQAGIATTDEIKQLKDLVVSEVSHAGHQFAKMSLDSIQPTSTIDDLVKLVRHATAKSHPRMY